MWSRLCWESNRSKVTQQASSAEWWFKPWVSQIQSDTLNTTPQHPALWFSPPPPKNPLNSLIRALVCVAVRARQNILAGYHFRNQTVKDFGQCWFKIPSPRISRNVHSYLWDYLSCFFFQAGNAMVIEQRVFHYPLWVSYFGRGVWHIPHSSHFPKRIVTGIQNSFEHSWRK